MNSPIYMERVERKYELAISEDGLPALCRDVSRYIPIHEFPPGQPITLINTIYFDNEQFLLLKNSLMSKFDHMRIRVRKYEYSSRSIAGPSLYWMELRSRKGEVRKKQRLSLERRDLERFFNGREITKGVLDYNQSYADPDQCKDLYNEMQNIVIDEGLKPILLVGCKRTAFEEQTVRFTIDWDICYYQAGWPIFRYEVLKDLAEKPCGREQTAILELKYSGELPSWVSDLQHKYPIRSRAFFSKPDRGMKALLEGPFRSHADSQSLLNMMAAYRGKDAQGDFIGPS